MGRIAKPRVEPFAHGGELLIPRRGFEPVIADFEWTIDIEIIGVSFRREVYKLVVVQVIVPTHLALFTSYRKLRQSWTA